MAKARFNATNKSFKFRAPMLRNMVLTFAEFLRQSVKRVVPMLRNMVLTFDQKFSIGEKSGEYYDVPRKLDH